MKVWHLLLLIIMILPFPVYKIIEYIRKGILEYKKYDERDKAIHQFIFWIFFLYKIIVAIFMFSFIVFCVLKNIGISLVTKVTVFIVIVGFFSILIIVGVNGENMLDFLWFMTKYLIKERVYVYRKTDDERRNGICTNLLNRIFQ